MKKILLAILGLVIVLFIGIYALLFTSFGNNIVAGILQDKVKESTGLDLNISKFKLDFSSLSLKANLNESLDLDVNGSISPLKLGFKLDYSIVLDKNYAKSLELNLAKNLEFKGQIYGKASDFELNGAGELLGANVSLNSRLYKYSPIVLNLDAKGIKIEQILALISMPKYASGDLNLNANVKAVDLKPDGNAIIKLDISSINYAQIKKDFGIDLPQNSNLHSEILASFKDNKIYMVSKTQNDYLKLSTDKTLYELENSRLSSDFKLEVPNLAKIESLSKVRLNGRLDLNGDLTLQNNKLSSLNAKILGLGDELSLNIKNEKLSLVLKQISLSKIAAMTNFKEPINGNLNGILQSDFPMLSKFDANFDLAGAKIKAVSDKKTLDLDISKLDLAQLSALLAMPVYADGKLNAKAKLNSLELDNLSGNITLQSSGILNKKSFDKLLEKNFPSNATYELNANADIKNSLANFKASLNSNLAKLSDFNGSFDVKKMLLASDYKLVLDDFSKLSFLLDRKLKGSAKINGKIGFDKDISFTALSDDLFKGKLNLSLKNQILKANLNGVNLSNLAQGFDISDIYEGLGDADINYNLASENGELNLNIKEGRLKKTPLTNAISLITLKDITDDVYSKAVANAKINKKLVNFRLEMLAKRSDIKIENASLNLATNALNVPFHAIIDRADFSGLISGTSDNPKVSLDAKSVAKTLKNVIGGAGSDGVKAIDKGINKGVNKLLEKLF